MRYGMPSRRYDTNLLTLSYAVYLQDCVPPVAGWLLPAKRKIYGVYVNVAGRGKRNKP